MDVDALNSTAFWHDAARYGLDLLGAVIILALGWWLSGWAASAIRKQFADRKWMDATLVPLLASIARYAILFGAALAVLDRFGIQMTSLVAVLGAAGLAIGLALQGTLSNVAAGVMLIVLRPFHIGDSIEAAGFSGIVEEVGLFATVIRTAENRIVTVPNKMLSDAPIINASRLPIQTAINIAVQIPYHADLAHALAILDRVAAEQTKDKGAAGVLTGVEELSDAAIRLKLQLTVPADQADAIKHAINFGIRQEFAAAGIRFLQEGPASA